MWFVREKRDGAPWGFLSIIFTMPMRVNNTSFPAQQYIRQCKCITVKSGQSKALEQGTLVPVHSFGQKKIEPEDTFVYCQQVVNKTSFWRKDKTYVAKLHCSFLKKEGKQGTPVPLTGLGGSYLRPW